MPAPYVQSCAVVFSPDRREVKVRISVAAVASTRQRAPAAAKARFWPWLTGGERAMKLSTVEVTAVSPAPGLRIIVGEAVHTRNTASGRRKDSKNAHGISRLYEGQLGISRESSRALHLIRAGTHNLRCGRAGEADTAATRWAPLLAASSNQRRSHSTFRSSVIRLARKALALDERGAWCSSGVESLWDKSDSGRHIPAGSCLVPTRCHHPSQSAQCEWVVVAASGVS